MINPKISILLSSFGIFVLFELFYHQPQFFYFGLLFSNIVLLLSLRNLPEQKFKNKKYWKFLILPFFFLNSSAAYISLLNWGFLIHFLIIITAIFIYLYLRQIYLFQVFKEHNIDLANISSLGVILTFFFFSSSIYGLKLSLHLPIWMLILVLLIISSLISYKSFWVNNIDLNKGLLHLLIINLVIVQIAWTLFFLPFSYNILGVILTICYYIIIGMNKFYLKGTLDKKRIKFYLGFGLSSLFLILLTSQVL